MDKSLAWLAGGSSFKVAYSFYKEGIEIQDAVDIDTELSVYLGEWRYKISFAYTTNGTNRQTWNLH